MQTKITKMVNFRQRWKSTKMSHRIAASDEEVSGLDQTNPGDHNDFFKKIIKLCQVPILQTRYVVDKIN